MWTAVLSQLIPEPDIMAKLLSSTGHVVTVQMAELTKKFVEQGASSMKMNCSNEDITEMESACIRLSFSISCQ
jgi:hypothetical protein